MADYQKMYATLCRAVDQVISPLERIPLARPYVMTLKNALEQAEDIYIESSAYWEEHPERRIIFLSHDGQDLGQGDGQESP